MSSGNGAFPIEGVLRGAPMEFDTFLAPAEHKLIDFASNPDGGTMALAGPPGTGKSRLLQMLAEKLKPHHTVRVQTAKPLERDWPFSGVSAFVAGLDGPRHSGFEALLHGPTAAAGDRNAVASGLLALIHEHKNHDRVIVLNGFDRLDAVSQEVLGFAFSRLSGTGLRVVVSVSGSKLPEPLAGTPTVNLGRLSTRQLTDLCAHASGPSAAPSTLHMIAIASHGNPACALSILRRLPASQISGQDPLILPFITAMASETAPSTSGHELSDRQRWVLQLLSTARNTPRHLLESVDARVADVLEDLEHAGLVRASDTDYHLVQTLDERVRSATYWSMSPDQRRLIHQQLAEHAEPRFLQEAVWHRSFLPGANTQAIELMAVACRLAEARRPIDAVEHAERALVLGAPQSSRFPQLGTRLSFWLMASGEFAAAMRYAELSEGHQMDAGSTIDLALVKSCAALLTRQRASTGSFDDDLRTHSAQAPGNAVRALAYKALLHLEMWDSTEAENLLSRAQGLLPQSDDESRQLHREVLVAFEAFNRRGSGILPPAKESLRDRTSLQSGVGLLLRARALSRGERYAEAGHLLDIVLDNEATIPSLWRQAARSFAVENEILAGNHERAMSRFDALAPGLENHQLQTPTLVLLKLWHLHATGATAEAANYLAQHRSGNQFASIPSMTSRAAAYAGSFALMHGDIDAAATQLGLAMRCPETVVLPHLLRAAGDLIEALVLQGNQPAAARVLIDYEAQVALAPTRWLRLSLARARAVAGDPTRADENFVRVRRQWTPADGQFELGRIMLAHAQQLLRAQRVTEASVQLKSAAVEFNATGATGWARRCSDLLSGAFAVAQTGVTPASHQLLGTLSSDERIIVDRVLHGQRNKDIAREIHVSLRTVEVRLTSVYRKLGARSRSHLAAMIASGA